METERLAVDIQKLAIQYLIDNTEITFTELVTKALQRTAPLPIDIEHLTYDDALKVIEYANCFMGNAIHVIADKLVTRIMQLE